VGKSLQISQTIMNGSKAATIAPHHIVLSTSTKVCGASLVLEAVGLSSASCTETYLIAFIYIINRKIDCRQTSVEI